MYLFTIILFSVIVSCFSRTDMGLIGEQSCYEGSYAVTLPPFGQCSGFRQCEPGYYCINGSRKLCPSGRYGSSGGLNSSSCTGPCPAGFYCPEGTISAESNMCGGTNLYCPEGSSVPLNVTVGYYGVDDSGSDDIRRAMTRSQQVVCPRGHYCQQGIKYHCPGGTYGNTIGLSSSSCTGECLEGWYCPPGSTQPFQYSCISSQSSAGQPTATVYCPAASVRPLPTAEGYYAISSHFERGGGYGAQAICPRGSHCLEGVRRLCAAGRYGVHTRETNSSCTGPCTAGYYCPAGSISDKQIRCPDAASYCPQESAQPVPVSPGHYTVGHEPANYTFDIANFGGSAFAETARTSQAICEPGYYCLADGKLSLYAQHSIWH